MYSDTSYPTLDHAWFHEGSSTDETTLAGPSIKGPTAINASSTHSNSSKEKETHLYKTEYCRNWTELGECRYGKKCRYAHGITELRKISRHNRYKTKICRAYHVEGTCHYGNRCTFIHDVTSNFGDLINPQQQPKVRQHSRFFGFTNNDQDAATSLQTTKIWDSKIGLGIQHSQGYSNSLTNKSSFDQSTFLTTTMDNVDDHQSSNQLSHPLIFAPNTSLTSSVSNYSFSFSPTLSLSSIKTTGTLSTLDSVPYLAMETKRNHQGKPFTTTNEGTIKTMDYMLTKHYHSSPNLGTSLSWNYD
ncbi:hypothetical protein BC941DRAFT_467996 [Chlamydoabsidia padenii]|nr:hypothetical protein BC941DRAFT_467996 [Chlamydoabsidia padenii]